MGDGSRQLTEAKILVKKAGPRGEPEICSITMTPPPTMGSLYSRRLTHSSTACFVSVSELGLSDSW